MEFGTDQHIQVTVKQLFDWSDRHWIDIHHHSKVGRLEGEMKLYELYATGEAD